MFKVRLITISYNTEDQKTDLHVWQEFETKQKAIDFINEKRYPSGLPAQRNRELWEIGYTVVGREFLFILYPCEQTAWIKTLVKELL